MNMKIQYLMFLKVKINNMNEKATNYQYLIGSFFMRKIVFN